MEHRDRRLNLLSCRFSDLRTIRVRDGYQFFPRLPFVSHPDGCPLVRVNVQNRRNDAYFIRVKGSMTLRSYRVIHSVSLPLSLSLLFFILSFSFRDYAPYFRLTFFRISNPIPAFNRSQINEHPLELLEGDAFNPVGAPTSTYVQSQTPRVPAGHVNPLSVCTQIKDPECVPE